MKNTIIILATLFLSVNSIFAQGTDEEMKELYPDTYTFEKANEFQTNGAYEKAIWFYINLFPDNKTQVVKIVKEVAVKLDTVDMSWFIKKAFTLYAAFDPAISSFDNGVLNMDMDILKLKGAWGDELIQKISDPDEPLNSASEYNFRGLDKMKTQDYNGAIGDFDKALDIKETGQIYFNRAFAKSMKGDFMGAIGDYDKTIGLNYRLAEAYFERGYCKDLVEKHNEAIGDFTKAIEIDKAYSDAYNNRAFIYFEQKDYKEAINDFDNAIKINPGFAGAYMNRGVVKHEISDNKGACKDWKKAVELGLNEANEYIKLYCK